MYGEFTPVIIVMTLILPFKLSFILAPHITLASASSASVIISLTFLTSSNVKSSPPLTWIKAPTAPS